LILLDHRLETMVIFIFSCVVIIVILFIISVILLLNINVTGLLFILLHFTIRISWIFLTINYDFFLFMKLSFKWLQRRKRTCLVIFLIPHLFSSLLVLLLNRSAIILSLILLALIFYNNLSIKWLLLSWLSSGTRDWCI
jgi:hypothetical protein